MNSTRLSAAAASAILLATTSAAGDAVPQASGPSGPVAHAQRSRPPALINLELAVISLDFNGSILAASVSESGEGATDLNGDGDALDDVLHVRTGGGPLINLGIAVSDFEVVPDGVLFVSDEVDQGADINTDGDTLDLVLQRWVAATGLVQNFRLAVAPDAFGKCFEQDGNLLAIAVPEADQGNTDLNGDADSGDLVLHVRDLAGGVTLNVGRALQSFGITGTLLFFNVDEAAQGTADLNADGDSSDFVLHYRDFTGGGNVNLGIACAAFFADAAGTAFLVREADEGATDLNADADTDDLVLFTYDQPTDTITNLGLAIPSDPFGFDVRRSDGRVAFLVEEIDQGNTDLNGDLDTLDSVMHLHDLTSGTTTNLGLAVPTEFFSLNFQLDGDLLAFLVSEAFQEVDLNGDGVDNDRVLHVHVPSTGSTTNLGLSLDPSIDTDDQLAIFGDWVSFKVAEATMGSVDLNGDADASDLVVHAYSTAQGTTNLGFSSTHFSFLPPPPAPVVAGSRVAFLVDELGQGVSDLNGDGDAGAAENVLHLGELDTGNSVNLELGADVNLFFAGDEIALAAVEAASGKDHNGDGDSLDRVLHLVRIFD